MRLSPAQPIPSFSSTLAAGWRQEAVGPFFYSQHTDEQRQWALPPFYCHTRTPDVDWTEWEVCYPLIDYRSFGPEYQLQIAQCLMFSGGQTEQEKGVRRFTLFPIYFHQSSADTNLVYTAVVPFYGHLKNRLFRDDIKFFLFPLYSETEKKQVVTDNYLYPIFDLRHGPALSGWQVWPLAGAKHKAPTLRTNSLDQVDTVGGYDKYFVLWPLFFKDRSGLGATNPVSSLTLLPLYSQTRSLSRDVTSYGWPLGYNSINDRENGYVEHDVLWPLFVRARGSKTVTRFFPLYSHARNKSWERFLRLAHLQVQPVGVPALDRRRTRMHVFALFGHGGEKHRNAAIKSAAWIFGPSTPFNGGWTGTGRCKSWRCWNRFSRTTGRMPREYSPHLVGLAIGKKRLHRRRQPIAALEPLPP